METSDSKIYTFIKTDQKFIANTFPSYTFFLSLVMYTVYYLTAFVTLRFSDKSLTLDLIIWLGTYITPYVVPFYFVCALCILIGLFFRDYRIGFRQIKLEPNQITLYPKQKAKELQVLSWEHPIQSVFLSPENTLPKIDSENRSLILPAKFYSSTVFKITEFYDAKLINEAFQNED